MYRHTYLYVQYFMTDAVLVYVRMMVASFIVLQLFSAYNFLEKYSKNQLIHN